MWMYVVQVCMFERWWMLLKKGKKFRTRKLVYLYPTTCWWLGVDNRDSPLNRSNFFGTNKLNSAQ